MDRKIYSKISIIFILIVIFSFAGNAIAQEDQLVFKYNLQNNENLYYETVRQGNIWRQDLVNLKPKITEISEKVTEGLLLETSRGENGVFQFKRTLKSVVRSRIEGKDLPGTMNVDYPIQVFLNNSGKIIKCIIPEYKPTFESFVQFDWIRLIYQQILPLIEFPDYALKVGDSWEKVHGIVVPGRGTINVIQQSSVFGAGKKNGIDAALIDSKYIIPVDFTLDKLTYTRKKQNQSWSLEDARVKGSIVVDSKNYFDLHNRRIFYITGTQKHDLSYSGMLKQNGIMVMHINVPVKYDATFETKLKSESEIPKWFTDSAEITR